MPISDALFLENAAPKFFHSNAVNLLFLNLWTKVQNALILGAGKFWSPGSLDRRITHELKQNC